MAKLRSLFRKETLRKDLVAGTTLGVESVPDGLAGGLLAGVNPVYGLYGYMYGTFSGAFATSSQFMAVQATGAMAIIVADIGLVHTGEDPDRALFTLAVVTGAVMLVAGLLKLGSILRFVSNSVMVGFISAVGVNIVIGQLDNFTGYEAEGANRVVRAFDLLMNLGSVHFLTVLVGVVTVALILVLERTRLGPLGMVLAVIVGSALVVIFDWDVAQLRDIADVPSGLPLPTLPVLRLVPALIVPALSLAFVGLVQGAGIPPTFLIRMGTIRSRRETSSARASPTSWPAPSVECRWAAQCRRRRLSRTPALSRGWRSLWRESSWRSSCSSWRTSSATSRCRRWPGC